MNQQTRIEIQGTVMRMIDSFMINNGVSAAIMEDALNKVMVQLKDRILDDLMTEAYQNAAIKDEEEVKEQ